jgi:hypothetical protein
MYQRTCQTKPLPHPSTEAKNRILPPLQQSLGSIPRPLASGLYLSAHTCAQRNQGSPGQKALCRGRSTGAYSLFAEKGGGTEIGPIP